MVLTYDSCYRPLFSATELVRERFTAFIEDDWLRSLDFETLEKIPPQYVGDNLRQRANDVVWRVRADDDSLYLYMPIEFLPKLVDQLNGMIDGDVELHRIFSIWMRQLLHRRGNGIVLLPEVVNLKEVNMSFVQSLNELRQKGILQGKMEGEAYVLQKVLTQRFGPLPPDIASCIAGADAEQLEVWVDRLDAAHCLDDIFSEHIEASAHV